jgi:hypothetical protein
MALTMYGRGGSLIGRRGRPFGRVPSPVVVKPPPVTVWPPQDYQQGHGLTLTGPNWTTQAAGLWTYIGNRAGVDSGRWDVSRVDAAWYGVEPTLGTFSWAGLDNHVFWCQGKGITPIIDATYCTAQAAYKPQYGNVTVGTVASTGYANDAGDNRCALVIGDTTDSKGVIGSPSKANWDDIHATGTGIATGSVVVAQGPPTNSSNANPSNLPFRIILDKAPTSQGSGRTVTFGWYSGSPYKENDRHIGPDPDQYDKVARFGAAMADRYKNTTPLPIFEWWNEANGQFWKPAARFAWYGESFMWFYRAIKEVNPDYIVSMTGCSGNQGGDLGGYGSDAPAFIDALLGYMRGSSTWATWCTQSTTNFTTYSNAGNDLKSLVAAGKISPKFWTDYLGFHAYGFGYVSPFTSGADNGKSWLDIGGNVADPQSIAGKTVNILNIAHKHAVAAGSDLNLDKIMIASTESGTPMHPLAETGIGANFSRISGGITHPPDNNRATVSLETSYKYLTEIGQLLALVRPWPTGSGIPAKLFSGPVGKRWAYVNLQRLETVPGSYAGAQSFEDQGMYTRSDETARKSGYPDIAPSTLKTAGAAGITTRPNLNTGQNANVYLGSGLDFIDAWWRTWSALAITTTSLPNAKLGLSYSFTVATKGGAGIKTYGANGLGGGLSINTGTGAITGIPSGSAGTRKVTLTVTNDVGGTDSVDLDLVVTP